MSISRFATSAFSGVNEVQVGLASASFDFSLVKYEAPKEYKELGLSLSQKRRTEAEDGDTHVTAKKLAALFVGIHSEFPKLVSAYGQKASHIAKSETLDPRGKKSDSPFAEYLGADGSSIWAAATSGTEATYVYLLACLLSRMFSAPEATSIWVEIVEIRRETLSRNVNHRSLTAEICILHKIISPT